MQAWKHGASIAVMSVAEQVQIMVDGDGVIFFGYLRLTNLQKNATDTARA